MLATVVVTTACNVVVKLVPEYHFYTFYFRSAVSLRMTFFLGKQTDISYSARVKTRAAVVASARVSAVRVHTGLTQARMTELWPSGFVCPLTAGSSCIRVIPRGQNSF